MKWLRLGRWWSPWSAVLQHLLGYQGAGISNRPEIGILEFAVVSILSNVKLLVQQYLVIFGVVVEIAELLWVKNVVGSGDCSSCLGLGGVLVEVGFG